MKYNFFLRFIVAVLMVIGLLGSSFMVRVLAASESDVVTSDGENITIRTYIINDTSNARVTGKSIAIGYEINIDNIYCCTVRHDVSFTYGIVTSKGDIAQITKGKAYLYDLNTDSKYYPNRDSIYTTSSNGDPAKYNSTVKIYKKSNDALYKKVTNTTNCYASGKYN